MPYSPRISTYDTGTITTASNGSASYYTVHSITGRIYKVAALTAASGTLTITESGTGDSVFSKAIASGTNYSIYYPQTQCTDNAGTALGVASGNIWEKPTVNSYLRVQHTAGSAAAGYSFTNVKLYYL